ncbi:MAG: orotate phosphoribosyltransferase [Clostridiales bacterium]|jgi:orotate phosphoribosyltransferase|nr:orotate phosphoribosyltransferase [Clostridiales bacterium]
MLSIERVEHIFKETGVLLTGHFLLTSGRHSDKYMQCAKILQYPHYAAELTKHLALAFADDEIDAVIGPAIGGIILAYELARQLGVKNLFAERESGKMSLRRGFSLEKGSRVVIAEDTITTGGTVREVIELVRENGGIVAGVASLADRSMGQVDFESKFISVYTADVKNWAPDICPLCAEGRVPLVKPGSRKTI